MGKILTVLVAVILLATLSACEKADSLGGAVVVEVAANQVVCTGVTQQRCFEVRLAPDQPWQLLYGTIEGFDYVAGFRYQLKVEPLRRKPDSAQQSPVAWKLIKILDRVPEQRIKKEK